MREGPLRPLSDVDQTGWHAFPTWKSQRVGCGLSEHQFCVPLEGAQELQARWPDLTLNLSYEDMEDWLLAGVGLHNETLHQQLPVAFIATIDSVHIVHRAYVLI